VFGRAVVQQFRMVRQKLLNRMLDQGLHRHAAQHGRKLELPVSRLGNAGAELDPGFGLAGGQVGVACRRFRPGFARDFGATGGGSASWPPGSARKNGRALFTADCPRR
jgi:hypothetical protein